MSIYSKLLEIQKSVRGLSKDGTSGYGSASYQYVTGSKVLDKVRPKMDDLGLLLIPEIDSIDTQRIDYQVKSGQKSEMFTKVMMTYTWIDTETGERLPVRFGGSGQNGWDKGLGSALTYSERYFLLKFFHIATDEDDVDIKPNEDAAPLADNEPDANDSGCPNESLTPPKKRLKPETPAWNQAVERVSRGEHDLKAKLIDTYQWNPEIDGEFEEAVFNYKINNNIK